MADATVQEVKKLLDNPAVSDDVKRELLTAYVSRDWKSAGELKSYADRLGIPNGGLLTPFGLALGDMDKALDHAHKQINQHESAGGRQELGEGSTGAANSNSILDLGAPGLRYFEYFAPLYQKCVSGSDVSVEKARERYDEQRDIIFAALRADSESLSKSAATLADEITTQRNSWNTIDQMWTGQGAAAASSYVSGYLGQAGTAQSQVDKYAKVLSPAADALEKAVHDKAQFVANLYADTIGGKTPEQIDEIIYYEQHGHDVFTSLPEAARIVHMFGASAAPDGGAGILAIATNPMFGGLEAAVDLLNKAMQFATNFVERVFKPDVAGKWQGFIETCTATDKSVQQIYQRIVADANSINDHPFTASTGTLPPVTPSGQPPVKDDKPGHGQPPTPSPEQQGSGAGDGHAQAGGTPPVQPQQAPPPLPTEPSAPMPPRAPKSPPAPMPPTTPAAASSAVPPVGSSPSVGPGSPVPQSVSPQGFVPPSPSTPAGSTSSIDPVAPAASGASVPGAGKGVAWLRDASTLPQGWTINAATGELTPPAPGTTVPGATVPGTTASGAAAGVPAMPGGGALPGMPTLPGVESAPGVDAARGAGVTPGVGESAPVTPGADPAVPSITISDGHSTLTVAAEQGGAHGVDITVADPTGHQSHYTVEMGPDGLPHLTADPVDAPPATPAAAGLPPVEAPVHPGVAAGAIDAPVAAGTAGLPPPATPALISTGPGTDVSTGADASASAAGADAGSQADGGPQAMVGEPADNSGQVRAASATGWTGDGDTSSESGGPALAHTDPGAGAGGGTASVPGGGGGPTLNLGGPNGDSAGTSPVTNPADQWLIDGSEDAENSNWVSLGSVIAPEPAERATMGSVATMIGNGEEPRR